LSKDNWKKVRLGDIIEINPVVPLTKGQEYSYILMDDVVPSRRYVNSTKKKVFTGGGARFKKGDVIFARITPCLENGKISQVKELETTEGFGSTEFFVFRNINGITDQSFVYYLAVSDLVRKPAEKSMSGASGRQRANKSTIENLKIEIPPLDIQKKIASILSAYDDLIEINTRRIKILEEMAHSIYREWFVKFRFPGHEKVKMVKSEIGMIPEGWEVYKASDCIEINPMIKVEKDKPKPFVDMTCLSETSMIVNYKEYRTGSSGTKFQNGDTLFARITPCLENGKTGFVQFLNEKEVGLGSTEFIVLRSKNLSPEIVYLLARTEDFRNNAIKSMTGASGRQRVQLECFEKYLLAKPPEALIDKFTEVVRPMFQEVYILSIENRKLRKTRDLLLPKLISGEIDVKNLNISGI